MTSHGGPLRTHPPKSAAYALLLFNSFLFISFHRFDPQCATLPAPLSRFRRALMLQYNIGVQVVCSRRYIHFQSRRNL